MGQLRNALRAYAVLGGGPAATLRSLSELIAGLEPDAFATAFYAELDPATGELGWASAGHPPPLLTFPDASPRYFDADPSPPLGIVAEIDSGVIPLTPGAGILVYTDGLIERRHTDISDGLARLREIVEGSPADALSVDAIVRAMREGTVFMDDVCALLAVRSA